MPLTEKGKKIKRNMEQEYGKERGDRVFYASQNKGTIKGTHKKRPAKKKAAGRRRSSGRRTRGY